MEFDFETLVERSGANLKLMMTPPEVVKAGNISLDGAEPDFKSAPVIEEAVIRFAKYGLYGFTLPDEAYKSAVTKWMQMSRKTQIKPEWVDASNAYVWENMCVLRDYFAKHLPKARVCGGEGAYILWIDWSAYFSSGDELNEFLVKKAHVCLGEGSDYDSPLFTRVCMATPRKCLIKTLESIGEAFSKLGKEK